jgi:hypothetical protein
MSHRELICDALAPSRSSCRDGVSVTMLVSSNHCVAFIDQFICSAQQSVFVNETIVVEAKRTGQPVQEHESPHEQLEPQLQPLLTAHAQSEPGMLKVLLG